jgi:predicted nucleic acid-binding protein
VPAKRVRTYGGTPTARLKKFIVDILREPAVGKIDFHLQTVQVNGSGLRDIARIIQKSSEAKYFPKRDALAVKSMSNELAFKGLIVHEAVHALLDLKKATRMTVLSNEVAAYIAQVLYLLYSGEEDFSTSPRVFQETLKLVQQYNLTKGNVWLRWTHYQHLRTVVQQDPLYRKVSDSKLMPADGIRGR